VWSWEKPLVSRSWRCHAAAHQIGTPDEYGDNLVFLEDGLTKPVTRLAPRAEQVLFIKQTVGDLPVGGGAAVRMRSEAALDAA
jgi:hypothetical protein